MIRHLAFLLMLIGIGLFIYSTTLPAYKNPKAAMVLFDKVDSMERADYLKKDSELRTNRNDFMDLGAGISIFSVTILIFCFGKRIRKPPDLRKIKSLNRNMVLIGSNLVWLLMIPGTFFYYAFRTGRGDYPPPLDFSNSMMAQISTFFFVLIPLNIFLAITTTGIDLPARLFVKPNLYKAGMFWWEIFFSSLIFLNVLVLICFIIDGDQFSIPINLFFTYVLLGLRAGHVKLFR